MAGSFVDFVESLIYGSGLAPDPNHRDWLAAHPSPTGTEWLQHHVDGMLARYEAWLAAEVLPPVTPWDGVRRAPWDPSQDLPLPSSLDGTFTGVSTLVSLGSELQNRYTSVASELAGLLKAPFSYRYWSYLRWAADMRRRFQGLPVFPTATLYDRDGTPLSATPFCDAFNDLHRSWHLDATSSGLVTPLLQSTAGQRTGRGLALPAGEEFLLFHRDHFALFHRWLARTAQPPTLPQDMGRAGGWPPTGPPAVVTPPSPWAYNEAAVGASGLMGQTSIGQVGAIEGTYHVAGHGQNTDIGPLSHNNYVPRFHMWHGWIDAQWWWREPRFVQSDPVTGTRTRIFRPVCVDGSEYPEPLAISIVRDLAQPADAVWPPNSVGGIDFTTGAGTLRVKMFVRDPTGRTLHLQLTTEVLDVTGAAVSASTVTVHRTIGPAGDHPLDAEFTEDVALAGAFASDDPGRANPSVGFVNGRIRVTGRLWVPDAAAPNDPAQSPDSGFVHEDSFTVDLVREKLAPEILIYQDLSSFSEDQVNATMSGGTATFVDAFFVVAQDRGSPSVPPPTWPPLVADEVKGLILGRQAVAGLFDDTAHAPDVVFWQESADLPFTGVTVQLAAAPAKEDAALSAGLPQRFTWRFAIVFATGHNAFDGLASGGQRLARLRVTARDRAGNTSTVETHVKLFKEANPYMLDGLTPWLSIDTRTFAVEEGQTRFGATVAAGQPLAFLAAVLTGLNAGTTGAETFDALPQEGEGAALEYAQSRHDFAAGTTKLVYNIALAKVRLQGGAGAQDVRAFFRLFRYAEPRLLFSANGGYRAFADGAGRVVPLPGFESETVGGPLTSLPFVGSARVDAAAASLETQTDPTNVFTFPPGPTNERVHYFGVWLDFNDPNVRLPATYQSGPANGPFSIAALQPLRTLMKDFHQCMVVEIRYDGDPTTPGDSPSASDNLAQRNLAILWSANPGDRWTRTTEQAFELDLTQPGRKTPEEHQLIVVERVEPEGCPYCSEPDVGHGEICPCCGGPLQKLIDPTVARTFISSFRFERLVDDEAMSIAMRTPHEQMDDGDESEEHEHVPEGHTHAASAAHGHNVTPFLTQAAETVSRAFPFVFHPARWTETAHALDELMIDWGDLPAAARATLFLPAVAPEQIVNLRNLRHAPGTVVARPDASLALRIGGVTYVPLPPVPGGRLAGALTITLPEGTRAPERYTVDATLLRGGSTLRDGGFRVQIVVAKATELVERVTTHVVRLHEQLVATPAHDRWRPILEQRLRTERRRARGIAADAGVEWKDPTVWTDKNGHEHPIRGTNIRVVLEKIRILDDRDPWLKGAGEIDFAVHVRTSDNGGQEQRTRLPAHGHFEIASSASLAINETVFEGFVVDDLGIRIDAMERDTLDPDDNLGSYTRTFSCPADTWLRRYGPGDEPIEPEHVGYWQLFYRIERA
jgi:hypothetical protein